VWRAQLEHLRVNRRVVAFDRRGHGASDRARDGVYRIEALAEDLDDQPLVQRHRDASVRGALTSGSRLSQGDRRQWRAAVIEVYFVVIPDDWPRTSRQRGKPS
jgi:hypothetical protein